MKERPILFSAPMVRALLAGTKTQTRRVIKPQPTTNANGMIGHEKLCGLFGAHVFGPCMAKLVPSPYGAAGDRLWVREAFRSWNENHCDQHDLPDEDIGCNEHCNQTYVAYRATRRVGFRPVPDRAAITYLAESTPIDRDKRLLGPWKPGIHLPRAFSRITLEIVELRVQRLHEISETDAAAEGVEPLPFERRVYPSSQAATVTEFSHRAAFQLLWESINGAESWRSNPWVWCVSFKRVQP